MQEPKKIALQIRLDPRIHESVKKIVDYQKKVAQFGNVSMNSVIQSLIVIGMQTLAKVQKENQKEKEGK